MAEIEELTIKEINIVTEQVQEINLVTVKQNQTALSIIPNRFLVINIVKKISLVLILALIGLYIMLMGVIGTSIFYISNLQNGLIQTGIFVEEINVANLTSEQAIDVLNANLNGSIPEYISLKYKDNLYELNLKEIDAKFDLQKSVEEAYEIGRTKNVVQDLKGYINVLVNPVNIEAEIQYNEEKLSEYLENLEGDLPDKVTEYSHNIERKKLVITRGKSGVTLDKERLKNVLLSNLENRNYGEIDIPMIEVLPQEIDVDKIHEEVFVAPQDAYFTENPLTIYEQVIGVDFDVQNAKNIIASNPGLEKYSIELIFTQSKISVKDLEIFRDVLSAFNTKHSKNENRTINLKLAVSKINGTVLMPGETFSFNKIVGERTAEAGYKNAAIFVNGEVDDGLAGGICQISSTLYNAVVGADLKIKERRSHSKLTSYLPGGKDATVSWGVYDFQFVNSRKYPIKIEMSVQKGKVFAVIYGIKSNQEYDINIESKKVGTKGQYEIYEAYKVYMQNGQEIKREFLSKDFYK